MPIPSAYVLESYSLPMGAPHRSENRLALTVSKEFLATLKIVHTHRFKVLCAGLHLVPMLCRSGTEKG